MSKRRFVLVAHRWFVSSYGFQVRQIDAETPHQADMHAAVWQRDLDETLNKAAVTVVEIEKDERLVRPRRLTWGERLTGWTQR